jgi:hypothetical protein
VLIGNVQREPEKPDILSWLIDAEKNSPDPINSDKRQVHLAYSLCSD